LEFIHVRDILAYPYRSGVSGVWKRFRPKEYREESAKPMSRLYRKAVFGQSILPPATATPVPVRLVRRLAPLPMSVASHAYRGFVIIGKARSGTTMLVSAINEHAGVLCYGEVFHHLGPSFGVLGMPDRSAILRHYRPAALGRANSIHPALQGE